MDKLGLALLALFGFVGAAFLLSILATALGGVSGWIFEGVFTDSFAAFQAYTGITASGFETGAALGFFGSFFRATNLGSNS